MRDFGNSNDSWDGRGSEESQSFVSQIPAFLMDPLGILERRWPLMLAAVVLGLIGTVYAVAQSSLTYLSSATVVVTDSNVDKNFVKQMVEEDTIANIKTLVGKIQSNERLSKLIEDHGLYEEQRDLVPMSELAARLRKSIEVAPQQSFTERRRHGESSVIYSISFEHGNADTAANVANALAGLLQEASIEARSKQARHTTSFLQRELENDEREYRAEAQRVSDFRKSHRGSLPDELQTNLRKLELLGSRRESLVSQIADSENRLMTVGSGSLEMQLAEARAEFSKQSALYTDDHPNVQALRYQIQRLEQAVLGQAPRAGSRPEFDGLMASGQGEIQLLKNQVVRIDREIADLNARVDLTPSVTEELEAMEQKVEVLRTTYHNTLSKVQQAERSQNFENSQLGAQVQVLDAAVPPTAPKRSRRFLAFAGLLGALALAAGIGIVMEIFDPVIVTSDQLERIVGRPVLGSLPRLV